MSSSAMYLDPKFLAIWACIVKFFLTTSRMINFSFDIMRATDPTSPVLLQLVFHNHSEPVSKRERIGGNQPNSTIFMRLSPLSRLC